MRLTSSRRIVDRHDDVVYDMEIVPRAESAISFVRRRLLRDRTCAQIAGQPVPAT
jgi:hypothetical protein